MSRPPVLTRLGALLACIALVASVAAVSLVIDMGFYFWLKGVLAYG